MLAGFVNGTRRPGRLAAVAFLAAAAVAPQLALAQGQEAYPQAMVEQFIRGCVSGGGTEDACSCTLRKMEGRYTLEQFRQISADIMAGTVPDDVRDDIVACVANPSA